MAFFARAVAPLSRSATRASTSTTALSAPCRRCLTSSPVLSSGHNKWSKIRHGKAINDAKKMNERTMFVRSIALASKLGGPDPKLNPQLANIILEAKRSGVPKDRIENAIARGQGRSAEGKSLEPVFMEIMMPPSVAVIVHVETDNRTRSMMALNKVLKLAKGNTGSTMFFFRRVGRIIVDPAKSGATEEQILDEVTALEAEDMDMDDDGIVTVLCEPTETKRIAVALQDKLKVYIRAADIIWKPNEDTMARLETEEQIASFKGLLEGMAEDSDVQAIYSNVSRDNLKDEDWAEISENLTF